MSFFAELLGGLQEHGVRYVLVGGLAVNIQGFVRLTEDVDIVISLAQDEVDRFVAAMVALGMKPRMPLQKIEQFRDPAVRKDWVDNKHMQAFCLTRSEPSPGVVDVLISEAPLFEEMYRRRDEVEAYGVKVSVASIDDLIRMKKRAGREVDLWDIAELTRIKRRRDD